MLGKQESVKVSERHCYDYMGFTYRGIIARDISTSTSTRTALVIPPPAPEMTITVTVTCYYQHYPPRRQQRYMTGDYITSHFLPWCTTGVEGSGYCLGGSLISRTDFIIIPQGVLIVVIHLEPGFTIQPWKAGSSATYNL